MLKRKVLVKEINNLSDARYCAGMGVNYICFDLNPDSSNFLASEKIKEIKNWLVGISCGVDLSGLSIIDVELLKELEMDFVVVNPTQLNSLDSSVNYFVNETLENSEGKNCILHNIKENQYDLVPSNSFVENQWNQNTISQLMEKKHEFGIVLYGGQEARPGFSDYGDLMDILELLED